VRGSLRLAIEWKVFEVSRWVAGLVTRGMAVMLCDRKSVVARVCLSDWLIDVLFWYCGMARLRRQSQVSSFAIALRRGIQKFPVKILVRGVGDPDFVTINIRPLVEVSNLRFID
jgi:hypothetical protein